MSRKATGMAEKLKQAILDIRRGFRNGDYGSEAAISQGVVLRLLGDLGWPTYDTQTVIPEHNLAGTRVDYALCHPPVKPIVFVEVKKSIDQGQRDKAERQLFQYAFHAGVPFAVLTDGSEWNFFLPSGHGGYTERRVYKLDMAERDLSECIFRLKRYLRYEAIRSGEAIQSIRQDYDDVARKREIQATLPKAWAQLVEEKDELLLDLIAEHVGKLCGYQPDAETLAQFLNSTLKERAAPPPKGRLPNKRRKSTVTLSASGLGFELDGKYHHAPTAKAVLIRVFETLSERDPTFAERFAALPKHGRKRRYLAQDRGALAPGQPNQVAKWSHQLTTGWWLLTNLSREGIDRLIRMACGVAQVRYGSDLRVDLGQARKQG